MELPTSIALLLFGIANFYIHEPQPQSILEGAHYLSTSNTQWVVKRPRWNHELALQQSPSYQQYGLRTSFSVPLSEHINSSVNAGIRIHSAQSRSHVEPQFGTSLFLRETDQFSTFITFQATAKRPQLFRYWEVRQLYEIDNHWSLSAGWQQHWWGTGIPTYGVNFSHGPFIIHGLKQGTQHKMGCTYARGAFSIQCVLSYPGPPEYTLRFRPASRTTHD